MAHSERSLDSAFRQLGRDLRRRRLAALDVRDRVVALAIAALACGFTYWQVRVPLDGVRRFHGPLAAAGVLSGVLAGLALLAAGLAAARQAALADHTGGPEWLALPLPPARVARHLLAEARVPALAMFPPALATLGAGLGLVPAWWLALLAAAFVVAWLESTRAGAALARRLTVPARGAGAFPPAQRMLFAGDRVVRVRRMRAPVWRRESRVAALARLDARASRQPSRSRARLVPALVLFALGAAAWLAPIAAGALERRAVAFSAYAVAASLLGAWAIARAGGGRAAFSRPLPLSLGDAWRARALPMLGALAIAAVANALLAWMLPGAARAGIVLTWWPPAAAVALLGLHYGLTLQGRAAIAENLYFGWLVVAMAGSIMIPFLGWGVMLAGLVHSGLRLHRWWRPEVA